MSQTAAKGRAKPRLPPAPADLPPQPPAAASVLDLFNPSPVGESGAAPARTAAKGGGIGGKLAKPGFGFHMRTADGEETVAPFRSLEDLLSAAKNILRGSAKSPDPVWFSIQPLDLATIDADAA